MKAPFPWYGGKSRAAPLIWQALGDVPRYVEPFAGSLATLLQRPHAPRLETINDKDAFVCNVWRALQAAPTEVAAWCARPVNEADLHAFHTWLVPQRATLTARLMGDPDYYEPQVAGRWLYGIGCWLGRGWCSGRGPWQSVQGLFTQGAPLGAGCWKVMPHLGGAGGNLGIHGAQARGAALLAWFTTLQDRLRTVRVCCGNWDRVLSPTTTWKYGLAGILLDPPYAVEEGGDPALYAVQDGRVAHAVRDWCVVHGAQPLLRIVLCGYGTTHDGLLAHGWTRATWSTGGGYGNQRKSGANLNKARETLWCSPACLPLEAQQHRQLTLEARP